jgi:uncharacterized SAM-binding protein YcdF (DUF218 family)
VNHGSRPFRLRALMRHAMSRGFSLSLGVLAAPLLPLLSRAPRFRSLPERLLRSSPPGPADLIHVLGGGLDRPDLRVDHGVSLFRRGLAPRLLLTGTGFGIDWSRRNGARARELGVPDGALILDASPRSTRAEARLLGKMALEEELRSVIVVTEAFHAGRAARLCERATAGTGVRILSCPADLDGFPPRRWWQDLHTRSLLLGEAARLLVARTTRDA